ncbi:hypothetical protein E7744_00950 [Citricoccus sp. SGAir0253]|uniref:hypothetical protein n=1 Tax=Citricoccus sp. SGAir0253 TaxID=2567881 RepID=UPI0010CD3BC7|nr:hypothetical protein [Citricoccus sp. SGAir0253]QCU76953.1 hypothetical protein E7744_00950 [Citricoccus sp. SGAir0253]
MRFRNIVDQAKSYLNSPQGRQTLDGIARAARQRGSRPRGTTPGTTPGGTTGRASGVDRALGMAERFLRNRGGRGGRPGGGVPPRY